MNKKIKLSKKHIFLGTAAGLLNGILGSGGGIILVAGSTLLFKEDQKRSQASALPVMLCFSLITAVIYILNATPIRWNFLIPIVVGSAAGGIIGAKLLPKLSNKLLKIIFGIMIIIMGVRMLCS